jgi:hypothetical protein
LIASLVSVATMTAMGSKVGGNVSNVMSEVVSAYFFFLFGGLCGPLDSESFCPMPEYDSAPVI